MDDVGHICDGHLVTIDEYLETEQKYVDAVIKVMELTNCKYLTVSYLGDTIWNTKYSIRQMQSKKIVFHNMTECYTMILWNLLEAKIYPKDIDKMVRLNLREYTYTALTNLKNKLEIHFGSEFYMYFNTKMSIDILREEMRKIGLYLDPR